MYKVVADFVDLQDSSHRYYPGDIFPREGLDVKKERLKELATTQNKQNKILIRKIEDSTDKENPKVEESKVEEAESVAPKKPRRKKNT